MSPPQVQIEQLVIYPIKSCGALPVSEFVLGENGPLISVGPHQVGDREWMIVNPSGEMFTQRKVSKMSLLTLKIQGSHLLLQVDSQEFEMPLKSQPGLPRLTVEVWGSKIDAEVCPVPQLNQALGQYLGEECLLVHFDQIARREASKKGIGLGVQTRFTDTSPYLVLSQESLAALNEKMENKIGPERFRGNIIVSGGEAFGEDKWLHLQNEQLALESSKACGRCVVITIDPLAGRVANNEPLKTLAKFRRDGTNVFFGQYFISKSFGKILRVGDSLSIVDDGSAS